MLTVLLIRPANAFDLMVSLQGLVAGAVDGLVREAIMVDPGDEDVSRVADHAGCRVLAQREVLDPMFRPKGDWLLMPVCGERLAAGWIEAAARHMGGAGSGVAARFTSLEPRRFWRRWRPPATSAWLVPTEPALRRMRDIGRIEGSAAGLRAVRLQVERPS